MCKIFQTGNVAAERAIVQGITNPRKERTMLNIFAKSIMTATRNPDPAPRGNKGHLGDRSRFDTRRDTEIEAHRIAHRRD
jgi:hypothetical protein